MDEKEFKELAKRYPGGSVFGGWGDVASFPEPSQRIEAPKPDPQTPHEGIEWEQGAYNVIEGLEIIPSGIGQGYYLGMEGDEYWIDITPINPECIDIIIAKLEHFKRVVFGEGE